MDNVTQKFKVRLGLFIAVGSLLFFLAIFIIGKQKNLFNPVFKLTTTFNNVSGLQVGNNIRFSGINVGTVDDISIINDSTVQVEMSIKKEVNKFIKSDCKVTIGSAGLIGDKLLIITQGSSGAPPARDGQQLYSREPVEIDAILTSLHVAAGSAKIISKQLEEVMYKLNNKRGTFGRLIQDSSIIQNLDQTIINLKNGSKGLDENMNVVTKKLLASLQVTSNNAEIVSNQLSEIMLKINSGNGTIGRLINDTSIVQNLEQIMLNLKKSSESLDEDLNAAKENIFLREYFKRNQKEAEKAKNDSIARMPKEQVGKIIKNK
jgi:phospholipid/cholesterol/gamma-HCH transport system substrate-binding protein